MKTVKEIEAAIKELPRVEFMALANVIAAHQAALWEEETDTAEEEDAGKLNFLYEAEEEEQFDEKEDFEFAGY